MTQEEKRLLLIDLCARLPYGVKVHITDEWFYDKIEPYDRRLDCDVIKSIRENQYTVKPYLRPISSITDEEWKEFEHLVFGIGPYHNEKLLRYSMKVVDNTGEEQLLFVRGGVDTDWFNAHHFDYRGLIEKGLALEASEDMYKTE